MNPSRGSFWDAMKPASSSSASLLSEPLHAWGIISTPQTPRPARRCPYQLRLGGGEGRIWGGNGATHPKYGQTPSIPATQSPFYAHMCIKLKAAATLGG